MKWISHNSRDLPEDDQTVLVYNQLEEGIPILAYYEKEKDRFYPLNSLNSFPIIVTHWMAIVAYPKKEMK